MTIFSQILVFFCQKISTTVVAKIGVQNRFFWQKNDEFLKSCVFLHFLKKWSFFKGVFLQPQSLKFLRYLIYKNGQKMTKNRVFYPKKGHFLAKKWVPVPLLFLGNACFLHKNIKILHFLRKK